MRKKILAGNWKMNKKSEELSSYFKELDQYVAGGLAKATAKMQIAIAAPYTLLAKISEVSSVFGVVAAAQNVHWELAGAFTGEISSPMLLDIGIKWALIGHSERRQYFAETNLTVEKKLSAALKNGMTTIACVGESLAERQSGKTAVIVAEQVDAVLNGAAGYYQNLTIAYEPVWAIGTGLAATSAEAQEIHLLIRDLVLKRCGAEHASSMRILYGGSMNSSNTAELLSKPDIDGGLIGGASLKPKDFAEMINLALK
jgi:triosephosphate isomerase